MTKSEKSALADAIAMLNAIVNGSDENGNNNHQPASSDEENPSEKEIAFVRKMANDEPFDIVGIGVRKEEGAVCDLKIGGPCFSRMITAYLEKYCHE